MTQKLLTSPELRRLARMIEKLDERILYSGGDDGRGRLRVQAATVREAYRTERGRLTIRWRMRPVRFSAIAPRSARSLLSAFASSK